MASEAGDWTWTHRARLLCGVLACCALALACASPDEGDGAPTSPLPAAGPAPGRPDKLWGVDANYVRAFEEAGGTWVVESRPVDPIALFQARGARAFRLRIWVENHPGNIEPGTLENDALALAARAQQAGLYVVPTLFMSRGWGADVAQDAPLDWAALPRRGTGRGDAGLGRRHPAGRRRPAPPSGAAQRPPGTGPREGAECPHPPCRPSCSSHRYAPSSPVCVRGRRPPVAIRFPLLATVR